MHTATIPNPLTMIAGAVSWALLLAILTLWYGVSIGPAMVLGRGGPDG